MINGSTKVNDFLVAAREMFPEYEELDFLVKNAFSRFQDNGRISLHDWIFDIVNTSYCAGFRGGIKGVLKLVKQKKHKELKELIKIHKIK